MYPSQHYSYPPLQPQPQQGAQQQQQQQPSSGSGPPPGIPPQGQPPQYQQYSYPQVTQPGVGASGYPGYPPQSAFSWTPPQPYYYPPTGAGYSPAYQSPYPQYPAYSAVYTPYATYDSQSHQSNGYTHSTSSSQSHPSAPSQGASHSPPTKRQRVEQRPPQALNGTRSPNHRQPHTTGTKEKKSHSDFRISKMKVGNFVSGISLGKIEPG
jgi:hypothetical protein